MIPTTLADIAVIVGGRVHGAGETPVHGAATIDSREVVAGGLFAAIAGEHVDGHDFAVAACESGAAAVLASQPVDAPCVVVDDVTEALGRLARWLLEQIDPTVIAITGSQGKTSVKDLVAHLLEPSGPTVSATGSFNNELGVPLTVLQADAHTRYLVLEMGARGIGHIAKLCAIAQPDIGVVLNVGSAHLGEFGSRTAIAQAKGEIVEALTPDGIAVLNADDSVVAGLTVRTAARVLTFGKQGTVRFGEVELNADGEPTFRLADGDDVVTTSVPQVGAHHAANAAAAAAVALAAGLDLATIGQRLTTARERSAMRMARTLRADGVLVIDDAYNANPESMAAALRAAAHVGGAGRRVAAVLGEMLELGTEAPQRHREIGALAAELGLDLVVAVGAGAKPIADGAGERAVHALDVDEAVRVVSAWLMPDDVVLVKASRGAHLERVTSALLNS